ncbi:methyltransferase [Halalkalibaculum sp. DA3122]|uniref:methyltransferase n=1 Tax=Halalkalibaculum sp. DA3122 TaxID=3373607 RepID=UPI0037549B87
MPLKPNFIERFLINRGTIPGILTDMGLPMFQFFAMIGAMETGFFRYLYEEPANLETLAEKMNASERGLENLVKALEPMGYVTRKDGKLALSKMAKDMPIDLLETMAPYFRHQAAHTLPYVARGIKEAPENGVYGWEHVKGGEVGRGYQASMRWLASGTVDEVVGKIDLPEGAASMLDVGGSHGLYTVAFCEKYDGLKGTVLDWEIGLKEAQKTLEEHPEMADRIDLVERDFEKDELPGGYDFAFLGNIIHGVSPEGNQELFQKLSKATTNRGMVAIVDQFAGIKGSKFARAVAGLAGLNLFLFSGGRSYPFDTVQEWLADAGFTKTKLKKLKQPGFSLLVSQKE